MKLLEKKKNENKKRCNNCNRIITEYEAIFEVPNFIHPEKRLYVCDYCRYFFYYTPYV